MIDWDKLRFFRITAQAGSFTKASEMIYLSQSAISRQIIALENSLGVKLFKRLPRGLELTPEGEKLLKLANQMHLKIETAEAQIQESRGVTQGPLHITTSVAFGSFWLIPHLNSFLKTYPRQNLCSYGECSSE